MRESRTLNRALARLFFRGGSFDLDFKERAFTMADTEIREVYERLGAGTTRYRESDTTGGQMAAIAAAVVGPRVLEVGCGNGTLTERLATMARVTAVEVALHSLHATGGAAPDALRVAAALPRLPFRDGAFDTVVCSHTLEHIPRVWDAAAELRRVARERLVVVVPRQRYYRYTIDYHLHFFHSSAMLAALLDMPHGTVTRVDGDWLYVGSRDA